MFDIPFVLGAPYDMKMVVKRWVWRMPVLGLMIRLAGMIEVPEEGDEDGPERVLEEAKRALEEGISVMIFPEGTRSKTGALGRFHSGAFRLAKQTGADVLPLVFYNTRSCIHRGTWRVSDFTIARKIGPRWQASKLEGFGNHRALRRELQAYYEDTYTSLGDRICEKHPQEARLAVLRPYSYLGPYAEQYVYWKMRLDPCATFLHPLIPKECRILDLGCGMGQLAHFLHFYAPHREVLGVDYDERKIQIAQASARDFPKLRFAVEDLLEWRPLMKADVVLLIDVLHYWSIEEQNRILHRAVGALEPGGMLVIRDTDLEEKHADNNLRAERFSTRIGLNRASGPIVFRPFSELRERLEFYGLKTWQIRDPMSEETGNVVLVGLLASTSLEKKLR